ncbi:MAG: hypothetical protein Q8941_17835 [Bacteroidota bacterium]|nr:hypothetical protein [Bacteroidota bacterium]
MRIFIVFFLCGCSLLADSQKKYHCEYKNTMSFGKLDTLMKSWQAEMEDQGLPPEVEEQLLKQLGMQDLSVGYRRIVDAGPDSTFILLTKNETYEGNVKLDMPDQRLLFRRGEIHEFDSQKGVFLANPRPGPARTFKPDGNAKMIMNHSCSGYLSSDSSCRIWVAADLPAYINPGIIATNIEGAILAFELKEKARTIKSEMIKLE